MQDEPRRPPDTFIVTSCHAPYTGSGARTAITDNDRGCVSSVGSGKRNRRMFTRPVRNDADDLRIRGAWGQPRTIIVPKRDGGTFTGQRRLVAVVPAYNEATTVASVLTRLSPLVD